MQRTAPVGLSPREIKVLRLVANGRSNREIAETLFLSARTVERYITNLYAKIGVQGRSEAMAFAHEHALLSPRHAFAAAIHYVVPASVPPTIAESHGCRRAGRLLSWEASGDTVDGRSSDATVRRTLDIIRRSHYATHRKALMMIRPGLRVLSVSDAHARRASRRLQFSVAGRGRNPDRVDLHHSIPDDGDYQRSIGR